MAAPGRTWRRCSLASPALTRRSTTPPDPAAAIVGNDASAATLDAVRTQLGLKDPLPLQFGRWLLGVLHGDLGQSFFMKQPVAKLIGQRIEPTRAYLHKLPSGRAINLFFYDGPISRGVAFEGLLNNGEQFARRLLDAFFYQEGTPPNELFFEH